MQKIILLLLLFLSFNFGLSQNTHNYILNYKFINLEDDLSFIEKMIWEGGIQYTFFANEEVCFLIDFKINAPININLKSEGSTKVYLNYKNDKLYRDLTADTAYTLKEIKFEKIESGKTKFMGFEATKYKSVDGSIEVIVTKELPWYVQPCTFANNIFEGAILKLTNHKTKKAILLTDHKQLAEVPDEHKDIIKKIKNHPATKTKTIVSPFLAYEKEEYGKKGKG